VSGEGDTQGAPASCAPAKPNPLLRSSRCLGKFSAMTSEFTRFVILLDTVQGTTTSEPLIRAHVAFLRELDKQGKFVMGGPFTNYDGGLMIVKASSLDEAKQISESDPFVREGVRSAEVRCWELSCEDNNHMGMG
jgi:uncharacterized protein YciI